MRFSCICVCFLLAWFTQASLQSQQAAPAVLLRGDANGNGRLEIGDAQYLLDYFFSEGRPAICPPVTDINHNGRINITDAIFLLQALFVSNVLSIEPLEAGELAQCAEPLSIRRGAARFFQPDPFGNGLHCGLCHGTGSAAGGDAAGVLPAGYGLGDAAHRPSYFNGRVEGLVEALNQCRVYWMEAPALDPREQAGLEYLAFLESLGTSETSVPALSYRVEPPRVMGPARGDPAAGCELFAAACASCHGVYGEGGVEGLASSLWTRELTPDLVRRAVRLSGPRSPTGDSVFPGNLLGNGMPFWTAGRMSDLELEDLTSYLELAANPALRSCGSRSEEVPRLLRGGRFQVVMHGVRGRVEHWSDGTIRIRDFFYDGLGPRDVVVWLYNHDRNNFHAILDGFAVSEHLARSRPYLGENIELTLPGDVHSGRFNAVAIWCTSVQSTYARVILRAD